MSEMNVTSSTSVSSTYTGYQGAAKTEDKAKTTDTKKAEESGVVYEKSKEPEKKAKPVSSKKLTEELFSWMKSRSFRWQPRANSLKSCRARHTLKSAERKS